MNLQLFTPGRGASVPLEVTQWLFADLLGWAQGGVVAAPMKGPQTCPWLRVEQHRRTRRKS